MAPTVARKKMTTQSSMKANQAKCCAGQKQPTAGPRTGVTPKRPAIDHERAVGKSHCGEPVGPPLRSSSTPAFRHQARDHGQASTGSGAGTVQQRRCRDTGGGRTPPVGPFSMHRRQQPFVHTTLIADGLSGGRRPPRFYGCRLAAARAAEGPTNSRARPFACLTALRTRPRCGAPPYGRWRAQRTARGISTPRSSSSTAAF